MNTSRVKTWQSALDAILRERMTRPFMLSENDCAMFAADCVKAVTGHDFAADWRGAYRTEAEAAAGLAQLGGSLRKIAATRLGEEVGWGMAQAGDIALVHFEGRETFAVCTGNALCAPGGQGLVQIPVSRALTVWRCCRKED